MKLKDTRILKTVQRIRNRARTLKAIVNIISVELLLVTILIQVLSCITYTHVHIVIELWSTCMYIQTKLVSHIYPFAILGNLRTTTKFTTTTPVDWEKTGTRTSVSAGKRKLKMQSVGRSTTTTLNVNTNVKL